MSKQIILGDPHLGKGLNIGKPGIGSELNSRVQDQLDLLQFTLDTAKKRGADNIIITGDVFEDARPHPALIKYFISWLKTCEKDRVNVHIIVGNHDIIRSGAYTVSALDIIPALELPYANVYKDVETVQFDGVGYTFVPYRDRRMYDMDNNKDAMELFNNEFKNEFNKIKGHKVLVGHETLQGAIWVGDEIDDSRNEFFCPVSMFHDWDYVWMGHVHKPQVICHTAPRVAHIGSMDRSAFAKSEMDHDKILIFFDSEKDGQPFEEIILPTRPLRELNVSVPKDKETTEFITNSAFFANKEKSFKDAIVRINVILEGQEPENADRNKVRSFIYNKLEAFHICNFSEARNILAATSAQDVKLFDNTMDASTVIRTYAESDYLHIDSEEERSAFIELAMECNAELERVKSDKK